MDLLTINDPSGEHPNSYYFASRNKINNFSPLKDDLSCDVCVIGGGFTGLSTAIRLKERGFSVVLLEARRVGFGASGRNGGQVGVGQRRDQFYLEKKFGISRLFLKKSFEIPNFCFVLFLWFLIRKKFGFSKL